MASLGLQDSSLNSIGHQTSGKQPIKQAGQRKLHANSLRQDEFEMSFHEPDHISKDASTEKGSEK